MPIPRIIHQVWFKIGQGPSTPPREYDEMRASWRREHPDWIFMQWDLDKSREFLAEHYPECLEMFDGYKRAIYKIDAIRYFVLHHFGGFYVDQDTSCLQSLEPLRKHKTVLCLNAYTKKFINNNHVMGCEKGSKFFAECIRKLPAASLLQISKDSYIGVMGTAGPLFLTGAAMTYRPPKDIYTLPRDIEEQYLTHHEKHSWNLNRSILGDIGRFIAIAGGVTIGSLAIKKLSDRRK